MEAAYEGRVSLSEWLRQAANAKAATMGEPREMPKVMPEARQEPAPYSATVAPSADEAKTAFKADPKQVQQIRDLARDLAGTSGKCSADAPRGTVCKVCGKKH